MREPLTIEPNRRILIVDDNRSIHEDIRKILIGNLTQNTDLLADESFLFDSNAPVIETTPFDIDSVYQGQEALAIVQEAQKHGKAYALAFVDVRMPPGWDGIETITRLWEIDPCLQIVICTAFSDYSWKDILAKLGYSDNLLILKKPFDSMEVIQLACALTRKWLVSLQARTRLEDLDYIVDRRTTELQTANDALRQEIEGRSKAEEAFRLVFEASPIGIALLDTDLRLLNANSALEKLLGRTRETILGKDPIGLGWFHAQTESRSEIAARMRSGELDQCEIILQDATLVGRTGLLWARTVEIRGIQHVLCFVLDISERIEMETDLRRARGAAEEAARVKSEFLANMSHEIRTPLNGVLGLSSFLEDETLPESVRHVGSMIRTSGEILRRVLDDVLDFSKIESGKLELECEAFSLRDALEWSVGIYRKSAFDKGLQMGFSLTGKHYDRLLGDATRLRQVLTNLINNAVKFTEFGSIQVSAGVELDAAESPSYRLCLSVADTGIGIPADRMDRLFQSFSQVDASINRRFGGTGLGLAICKRLIEMMGGTLIVESQLGLGTTFRFSIPVGIAEPEPNVVADIRTPKLTQRILVVEDNPINCVVIRKMLERLGHSVDLVSDGVMAIRRIQETECDLVFMDVNMPELDGLEATRIVRALPDRRANVPIIALTASSLVNDRQACLQAGMNDFLSKPVGLDALRKVVDRWSPSAGPVDSRSIDSEPALL